MAKMDGEDRKKEKTILRKRILSDRSALLPKQREVWDKQILEHLIRYDRKNPCSVYLCYVNYKSEVNTKDFILWCLEHEKAVFVPKVLINKCFSPEEEHSALGKNEIIPAEMEFYQITAWEDLTAGYQGILEPEDLPERSFSCLAAYMGEYTESVDGDQSMPVSKKWGMRKPYIRMLLPGAVFDKSGNRVGYGGGFYDRWLAKWEEYIAENVGKLEKIGMAYAMQVVEVIPAEQFDKKVDQVVTEEQIL